MTNTEPINLYWKAEVSSEVLDAIERAVFWEEDDGDYDLLNDWLDKTREDFLKVIVKEGDDGPQ